MGAIRRSLIPVILSLIVLVGGLVLVLPSIVSFEDVWGDAKAVAEWDNPFCGSLDAFAGLQKAHGVTRRAEEIERASRALGEDRGLYLYETPAGSFWMPQANDLHSIAVVLAEQEFEMYGDPGGLGVHEGDVVIDGGAHVGLFVRTALKAGASKVVTFEVTPKSNEALRRNFANQIAEGKVVVTAKGVWREEGVLPLVIIDDCSICNSVSHPWMKPSVDVPLTTIDHAVAELELPQVDYIKLDVENAEANALRGATGTLTKFHPRLAVALENSKTRVAYGHEVLGIVQEAYAGYKATCGAVTYMNTGERILPEVLHFQVY